MLVEAHYSIEMIERYHESLRRIYSIFVAEIPDIDLESALQMSFKALNDSIEPVIAYAPGNAMGKAVDVYCIVDDDSRRTRIYLLAKIHVRQKQCSV